ncbi:MAG TPA: isoaspartyl peptidase/L-asparaginase [Ignavibacteria bacterium]|nr:beta-aspartyl-peptidase [Bacteroidota bacterium]HRI86502.1 isoaspartyl peptidase/L-asparaginase [Ignavibacteria bacterium]HRJ98205.1 isoaspartyl peptidase/L-asparaginase [Ignavibacteria bacterium]
MKKFGIAVHGGAGTILKSKMTADNEKEYLRSIELAVKTGSDILKSGGTSVDAVTESIITLEDNPLFNAGKGSVFTSAGTHSMDASIMSGKDLQAGSAASVCGVRNPILLAKAVMLDPDIVMISGKGAEEYAKISGLKFEDEKYFYSEFRYQQFLKAAQNGKAMLDHSTYDENDKKFGTVGAAALDQFGDLAAGTSTGGMTYVKFGRVGDSPLIGAGTYANNNTCAVSCTGDGEFFIRTIAAYDISALMEYKGLNLKEACEEVVNKKLRVIGGEGGLIAIDKDCNIEMIFNSQGMYRGYSVNDGKIFVSIYRPDIL